MPKWLQYYMGWGCFSRPPKMFSLFMYDPMSPLAAHFYWNSGEKRERWAFQTVGKKVRIQEYMNAHLCLPTCLLPKPFLFVCLLFVESVHQGSSWFKQLTKYSPKSSLPNLTIQFSLLGILCTRKLRRCKKKWAMKSPYRACCCHKVGPCGTLDLSGCLARPASIFFARPSTL